MSTFFGLTNTAGGAAPSNWSSVVTRQLLWGNRGGGAVTLGPDATVASLVTAANPQGTGLVAPVGAGAGITLAAATTVESGATIGANRVWLSDPINAVTISSGIAVTLRALESAAQANYGCGIKIYRVSGGSVTSVIAAGSSVSEAGTSETVLSMTLTPTSTAMSAGDQILVFWFYVSAGGTSTSGRTASVLYNGVSSGATGDSNISFTETFTLQPAAAAAPTPRVVSQAVQRAATRCWKRRPSGIVVPRLWTPEAV